MSTRPRLIRRALLATAIMAASGAACAADLEAGKKLLESKICVSCHGPDGGKPITPDIPKLSGQYYDYLVHALKAYRSGARDNPTMNGMAKPLTDEEIKNMAWYLSTQPGLITKY